MNSIVSYFSSAKSKRHLRISIFDRCYVFHFPFCLFGFVSVSYLFILCFSVCRSVCLVFFIGVGVLFIPNISWYIKLIFYIQKLPFLPSLVMFSLLKCSLFHASAYGLILGKMLQVLAQQERVIVLWQHICGIDWRKDVCFLHRKETFCH